MKSEARSARYGCTSNILPVAGLVTHLCTIPVRMGLDPPRETWNGGWAGSCGCSQVPGCHDQCRNESSGWRRTEQASQRMIYVGYQQSGTGCGAEMITAERPRSFLGGMHKVPECWATCELRFDHRQRKQHPRSSCTATHDTPSRRSHRELPENISHATPRRGCSVGTDQGACVRCRARLLRDQIAAQP